jgi:hypothetical protein
MATWYAEPPETKNTRLPGCSEDREIRVVAAICWFAVRGNEMPTCLNTYCTYPEQSKPPGDSPPYTYGVPAYLAAIASTLEPLALEDELDEDEDDEDEDEDDDEERLVEREVCVVALVWLTLTTGLGFGFGFGTAVNACLFAKSTVAVAEAETGAPPASECGSAISASV